MMNTYLLERQMDGPCLGLCLPPNRLWNYFEVFVTLLWKTGDGSLSNSSLKSWSCCFFNPKGMERAGQLPLLYETKKMSFTFISSLSMS